MFLATESINIKLEFKLNCTFYKKYNMETETFHIKNILFRNTLHAKYIILISRINKPRWNHQTISDNQLTKTIRFTRK